MEPSLLPFLFPRITPPAFPTKYQGLCLLLIYHSAKNLALLLQFRNLQFETPQYQQKNTTHHSHYPATKLRTVLKCDTLVVLLLNILQGRKRCPCDPPNSQLSPSLPPPFITP